MTGENPNQKKVYDLMLDLGYPEAFAKVVSREMSTEYTAKRMTGYLLRRGLAPLEEVADEMLAIQSDRDALVNKHITRHAEESINKFYRED